jgi:hypothetical protein
MVSLISGRYSWFQLVRFLLFLSVFWFDVDFVIGELVSYSFSPLDTLGIFIYSLLPTVYAEGPDIDLTSIHSSLASVQENTTPSALNVFLQ